MQEPTSTHSQFISLLGMALLSCLCLTGCQTGTDSKHLVITGSSTVAPVLQAMAKRYESEHPGTRIDVHSGGSSRGIADVRKGLADIGMISRRLYADEQDLHAHPIARDGITIIVHRDNPVSDLDHDAIIKIFTGTVDDWSTLGGNAGQITTVHKAAGRATRDVFLHYCKVKPAAIQADLIIGENEEGIKTVAGNPQAIAYVSIGAASIAAAQGTAIKLVKLDTVPPQLAELRSGRFPLYRDLTLVTKQHQADQVNAFIDWCRSTQTHDLIDAQGFIPLGP